MVWEVISYGSRSTAGVISNTFNANLSDSLVIQPIVLSFINSIQGKVFQQDITRPPTTVVTQRAVQSVNMLPWSARSPDLSTIEYNWISLDDNS
ncbi:transposable element Tc1 transposase [Trichonephila clavipes]|nr:transposable element Tc1 transposase [Trichonephila clavipes]